MSDWSMKKFLKGDAEPPLTGKVPKIKKAADESRDFSSVEDPLETLVNNLSENVTKLNADLEEQRRLTANDAAELERLRADLSQLEEKSAETEALLQQERERSASLAEEVTRLQSADENHLAEDPEEDTGDIVEEKKKSAELYDQLLRLKAEFENYRRRTDREKVEARSWGKHEILMPLLSIADIFEQAMDHARSATDPKEILKGLELLQKGFITFLRREGVQPIDTVGKVFDPNLSEAVEQVEVEEEKDIDQVIDEVQRGYTLQGKVLRPSRVRVGVLKKS